MTPPTERRTIPRRKNDKIALYTHGLWTQIVRDLVLVLVSGLVLVAVSNSSSASTRASRASMKAAAVTKRLALTQRQIQASQKASTATRVTTVSSRCNLTHLILGVLVRVHDTSDAAPFQASYQACLAQLTVVKRINAKTPGAK